MRWLDSITNSREMSLNKLWGIVKDRGAWQAVVHGGHKKLDANKRLKTTDCCYYPQAFSEVKASFQEK